MTQLPCQEEEQGNMTFKYNIGALMMQLPCQEEEQGNMTFKYNIGALMIRRNRPARKRSTAI